MNLKESIQYSIKLITKQRGNLVERTFCRTRTIGSGHLELRKIVKGPYYFDLLLVLPLQEPNQRHDQQITTYSLIVFESTNFVWYKRSIKDQSVVLSRFHQDVEVPKSVYNFNFQPVSTPEQTLDLTPS